MMFLMMLIAMAMAGCMPHAHHGDPANSPNAESMATIEHSPTSLGLDAEAQNSLNRVMREHLEAIHQMVAALGKEDFQAAQEVVETQLGFAKHREAMRKQMPRNFPPKYHDLAMAHHHAAEDLASVMSSHNLQRILPALANTLHACVACHRAFKR